MNDLPANYDRLQAALDIVDPGACNPSGVPLATLVTQTHDDGRSSQARSRAFVAASKSTIPDALGAKTPIATLHMQIVGLAFGAAARYQNPVFQPFRGQRRRPLVATSVRYFSWRHNSRSSATFGNAGLSIHDTNDCRPISKLDKSC